MKALVAAEHVLLNLVIHARKVEACLYPLLGSYYAPVCCTLVRMNPKEGFVL